MKTGLTNDLFSGDQVKGIKTMQQLHDKLSEMNSSYYDLRGKIVQAERRIATLSERGEMWKQTKIFTS